MHGGKLWVDSEEGTGSTFTFRLPVEPTIRGPNGLSRWLSPYNLYDKRVRPSMAPAAKLGPRFVVVERERFLQRLLTRHVDGAEVVSVASIEDALGELSLEPADALLINDGDMAERFQSLVGSPLPYGTPAIMCSMEGIGKAISTLGVRSYLVKPILQDTLLAALDRLEMGGKTVLIVDDEPDALRLFRRMLLSSGRGYRVLRASNGQQALAIMHEQHPNVVLLDLVMPGMDGFQVLERRSLDPVLRDIAVIVMSARDPVGEPIVSKQLTVTRGGGLSMRHVLDCVKAITEILAPSAAPSDLRSTITPGG